MTRRFPQFLKVLLLCMGLALSAGTGATTPAAENEVEEKVDEGLKGFGYLSGLALGCVATGQRKALEREVMDLHAEISRLLGLDRAFLYTASFGHGTGVTLASDECKAVLSRYEARVAKFRQGKGGR